MNPQAKYMSKIITITIEERETGNFRATSKDLPGFYMAHPDREAIIEDIPNVICAMFRAEGQKVVVFLLPDSVDELPEMPRFFACPAHIAAEQLQAMG